MENVYIIIDTEAIKYKDMVLGVRKEWKEAERLSLSYETAATGITKDRFIIVEREVI